MRVNKDLFEGAGEIHMAPLIDAVFLLLIFFLVAATLKQPHPQLDIELPESAAAAETPDEPSMTIIDLTRDGEFYIEGEQMTAESLRRTLREHASEDPNRTVRIDGDRGAAYQHLIHLVDLLQFEGLTDVRLRSRDGGD